MIRSHWPTSNVGYELRQFLAYNFSARRTSFEQYLLSNETGRII